MILNKLECILCDTKAERKELFQKLKENGYRFCNSDNITPDRDGGRFVGVRWLPQDDFPDCVAGVQSELIPSLLERGVIDDHRFDRDVGLVYNVFKYGKMFYEPSVDDLL